MLKIITLKANSVENHYVGNITAKKSLCKKFAKNHYVKKKCQKIIVKVYFL